MYSFWTGVSIHLMLLLIAGVRACKCSQRRVSIHLMLLLIVISNFLIACKNSVSIHLMLLLITRIFLRRCCWCLVSIHLMLLLIKYVIVMTMAVGCFNTSHVTINLKIYKNYGCLGAFQYISCYY